MALRAAEWQKLPTSLTELCIDTTLQCGQSFRYGSLHVSHLLATAANMTSQMAQVC